MLLTKGCPVQLPVCHNRPKVLPRLSSNRLRAVAFRKAALVGRQNTLLCRAEDRGSAVTDIRKIDIEKGGLTHTLRETVFTAESLVPVALGVGGAFLAGYGQDGAVLGTLLLDCICNQAVRLHACLICCAKVTAQHSLQVLLLEQLCGLDSCCSCSRQCLSPIVSTRCFYQLGSS